MRRKGMAQRVAARRLRDSGISDGYPNRLLQHGLVDVMPYHAAAARRRNQPRRREYILPRPFPSGVRVLPADRFWERRAHEALREVRFILTADAVQVACQRLAGRLR